MRAFLATLALLAFTACTPLSVVTAAKTPAQRIYEAQAALVSAQSGAIAYAQQPWCSDAGAPAPPACASPAVVVRIARAGDAGVTAIKAAQGVVAATTSDSATILDKVIAVERAVEAVVSIMSSYNIKLGGK